MAQKQRVAVLIDGENISAGYAKHLFQTIDGIGDACVRRVYGNRRHLQGWDKIQAKYRIESRKNWQLIRKKNSTDYTLIIDAITLLHREECDVFCIVSSDGDFSPLAHYIRQSNKQVHGFGETKAPDCLKTACTKFVELQHEAVEQKRKALSPSP